MIALPKEHMTTHDVIDFVVEHYGADPQGRRSVEKGPYTLRCVYDSPDGRQCAFRIFCRDEDARFVNESRSEDDEDPNAGWLLEHASNILLRPEVQGLVGKLSFWDDIQGLHDEEQYWDLVQGGLSEKGKLAVHKLKCVHPADAG